MEILKLVLIGAAGAALPTIAAYYFLSRRLYAVIRRYSYAPLSSSGVAVDLAVLNRGHRNEEDVRLTLDPNRTYELLAATNPEVSLNTGTVLVRRLPAGTDISAVIQVDGGDFSKANVIAFSSKEAKGEIRDRLELVPAPPGAAIIVLLVLAVFGGGGFAGVFYIARSLTPEEVPSLLRSDEDEKLANEALAKKRAEEESRAREESAAERRKTQATARTAALSAIGWVNTERFIESAFSDSFPLDGFPIELLVTGRDGNLVKVFVTLRNPTAQWMSVSVYLDSSQTFRFESENSNFTDLVIEAGKEKSRRLTIYLPANNRVQEIDVKTFVKTKETLFSFTRTLPATVKR